MKKWRVSFRWVSIISHPEVYLNERAHPDHPAAGLPEEYWHATSKEHDDYESARDQVRGLHQLMAEGEYIRNVTLEESAIEWKPVPIFVTEKEASS